MKAIRPSRSCNKNASRFALFIFFFFCEKKNILRSSRGSQKLFFFSIFYFVRCYVQERHLHFLQILLYYPPPPTPQSHERRTRGCIVVFFFIFFFFHFFSSLLICHINCVTMPKGSFFGGFDKTNKVQSFSFSFPALFFTLFFLEN